MAITSTLPLLLSLLPAAEAKRLAPATNQRTDGLQAEVADNDTDVDNSDPTKRNKQLNHTRVQNGVRASQLFLAEERVSISEEAVEQAMANGGIAKKDWERMTGLNITDSAWQAMIGDQKKISSAEDFASIMEEQADYSRRVPYSSFRTCPFVRVAATNLFGKDVMTNAEWVKAYRENSRAFKEAISGLEADIKFDGFDDIKNDDLNDAKKPETMIIRLLKEIDTAEELYVKKYGYNPHYRERFNVSLTNSFMKTLEDDNKQQAEIVDGFLGVFGLPGGRNLNRLHLDDKLAGKNFGVSAFKTWVTGGKSMTTKDFDVLEAYAKSVKKLSHIKAGLSVDDGRDVKLEDLKDDQLKSAIDHAKRGDIDGVKEILKEAERSYTASLPLQPQNSCLA